MSQVIDKLSETSFRIRWEDRPDFGLVIDFDNLIRFYRLTTNYCMLHWQAMPKGSRRWGIYSNTDGVGEYRGSDWDKIILDLVPSTLQVDENLVKSVPTAVLFFANSVCLLLPGDCIKITGFKI